MSNIKKNSENNALLKVANLKSYFKTSQGLAKAVAPIRAGARVGRFKDAVQHRVAHVDISRRHVDFGAQHV